MSAFKRIARNGFVVFGATLGLAAFQAPASAATFNIAFDAYIGTDGTGTFDAPITGGAVTNFVATFGSTVFNNVIVPGTLSANLQSISLEIATTTPPSLSNVLVLFNIGGINLWGDVSCSANRNCVAKGTYSISEVPIPAALPLFATGLAAVGYLGRKRKAKVAA
jgi:hypothetical protein